MEFVKKMAARLRSAAIGKGLASSWRDWRLPGGMLIGIGVHSVVSAALPGALDPLKHAVSSLLHAGFWASSGFAVTRFIFAALRREERLRALIAQGEEARLLPLLTVLDAEMTSRPALLRPHLADLLEKARALVAPKVTDPSSSLLHTFSPALRRWLFSAAPPGEFPLYAADLVTAAERNPGPECLSLLRDLRDPGAHIAENDDHVALRARADALINRLLGAHAPAGPGDGPRDFEKLLARAGQGRDPGRARAEQELRAMGPEAVHAAAGLRVGVRWWWHLPGVLFIAGSAAVWYLWASHILSGLSIYGPMVWGRLPWIQRMPPVLQFAAVLGALLLLTTWTLSAPIAWSRYRVRRLVNRMAAALSLIEGREAVAALLELARTMGRHERAESRRVNARARAARRLAGLPSPIAAELLVPHGDWFFRRPTAETRQDEWAQAVLAVIRHTWDPAARPLLSSWAKDAQCPIRAQAEATLNELDARIARQGTLLRPAMASVETLLRPADGSAGEPADRLLRASDLSAVGERPAEASTDAPEAIRLMWPG